MDDVQEYRCKVCGGMLKLDKESLGFSVCVNCGNKFKISQEEQNRLKDLALPKEQPIYVSMNEKDVEKERKVITKNNAIFAIKGVMALISLFIVAIFISLVTLYLKGNLSLGTIEVVMISVIGLGMPAIITIFAKVYKDKRESLVINAIMLLLFIAIFAVIAYFSFSRYFIGFI